MLASQFGKRKLCPSEESSFTHSVAKLIFHIAYHNYLVFTFGKSGGQGFTCIYVLVAEGTNNSRS